MKTAVVTIIVFILASCATNNGKIFSTDKNRFQKEVIVGMSEVDVMRILSVHFQELLLSVYECNSVSTSLDNDCQSFKKAIGSYKFGSSGIVCGRPTALVELEFDKYSFLVSREFQRVETCL